MADLSRMHDRARQVRARAEVRAWEYRQRHRAKGMWFRLRRLLAGTRECWQVSEAEAKLLIAEGFEPCAVGLEMAPPKTLLIVPKTRAEQIRDKTQVRIGLGSDLLEAPHLVLIPFD